MSKRYEVDCHPQRAKIVKALIRGESYRDIAGRFGVSKSALSRYMLKHLVPQAAKALAIREIKDGDDYVTALDQITKRVQKEYDACDEYLRDPDNPDKYYLGPRAEDVQVVFVEKSSNGKEIRRKESLWDMVSLALGENQHAVGTYWKHADPRKLLLDTAKTLNDQLKLLATIRGQIKDLTINISSSPVFIQFQQVVLDATANYPEVRKRITDALRAIDTSHGPAIPGGS